MRLQAPFAAVTGKSRMFRGTVLDSAGILLFFFATVAPASGQAGKEKTEGPPLMNWEFRIRSEIRDNFDLNDSVIDDNHPVLQRFRFSLAPRWKSLRFLAQIQDSPVWFRERSPYSSADFHLYQLYIESPVARGFRLRAGRQELSAGEERVLGAFGWDNRGRSFDAVSLYRNGKSRSLRFFAANLAAPRQHNFPRGQNLFGVIWKRVQKERSFEAYAFWLHDQTLLQGEEQSGRTRILTSGTRYSYLAGGWKQSAEAAWQVGKRNHDSHLAAALTYRSDYTWDIKRSPGVGFEYNFATGDGNPSDGKSYEFHNLYPTNHPFYGYMDLFGWRNLHNPRFIVALQPSKRTRLEANYHEFWLAQAGGVWKNAGGKILGRDPSGRSGRRVGGEVDLLGTCTISAHWKVLLGYSAFFPGQFASSTRGDASAQFAYLQLAVNY